MTGPLDAAASRIADRQPAVSPQADRRPQRVRPPEPDAAGSGTADSTDRQADTVVGRAAERAARRAARLAARRQEPATATRPDTPPAAAESDRERETPPESAPPPTILDLLRKLPPLPRPRFPTLRLPRLRLLPALIFAALIMLGVRVGDIWDGLAAGPATLAMVEPPPAFAADESADADEDSHAAAAEAPIESDNAAAEMVDPDADTAEPPEASGDLTPSELELLQTLATRREALETREQALTQREALLLIAERRIDEKMTELTTLRTQLEGLMGMVDEEQEQHLTSLVNIYETMRPTDAAAIFNGLDMDVLIDVLQRMREQKSAPILAAMEPERARLVTSELVMRRDLPELPE